MTADLRLAVPAVASWLVAVAVVGLDPAVSLLVSGGGALTSVVLGVGAWHRRHRPGVLGVALLAVACAAAVAASAGAQGAARGWVAGPAAQGATATVEGVVRSTPMPIVGFGQPSYRVTVDLRRVECRGVVQRARGPVTVIGGSPWAQVAYGSTVRAEGRLGLRDGDITLRADEPPVALTGPRPRVVADIRAALMRVTAGLPAQARGLVPGVAIGDTSRLEPDLDDDMRATSLTHITAVSGGHFAIVVSVVAAVTAPARRSIRVVVTAATMAGFVLLVHPEPAVLRAAAMGAVGVAATWWGRPSRAVAALGAAVVALLVLDPWLATSYGFVLSALATAGLALGAPALTRRIAPWCGRTIAAAVAIPVAAQAAVAPVLVLLDPVLTPYAVPANLLAAPALAPATVLGLGAALLAPLWPPGAEVLARFAGVFTGWIAGVARSFAGLPGARIPWLAGPLGVGLLAAMTLAVVVVVARRRVPERPPRDVGAALRAAGPVRVSATCAGALGAVVVVIVVVPAVIHRAHAPPSDWIVAACDVGQGDALAVRSGPDAALVVDVGPDPAAMHRCLDDLGVRRIDLLVLTHYHADHIGGLAGALRLPVGAALVPGPGGQPVAARTETIDALSGAGVESVAATSGMAGAAGTANWEVLQAADPGAGPAPEGGDESVANDAGVVLRVEAAGVTVVVLGDLEEPGQSRLVGSVRGPVDVVKVAHHGSASQSALLADRLGPKVALVSVGENSYGHPTDHALDLYRSKGALVARTDQCGTISVLVRDDELAVGGC